MYKPLLLLMAIAGTAAAAPAEPVRFNRDIRPILSGNCIFCHGPDANHRKGKLRLDLRDAALAAKAFVPGKPEESELVKRIRTHDENDVMPPPESKKTLTQRQKGPARPLDRRGRSLRGTLGLHPDQAPAGARRGRRAHRRLHRRGAGRAGREDVARVGSPRTAAPPVARPHRPAAHPRGGRRLRRGHRARRLRQTGRTPARLPALRRTHGRVVARCRALRRHRRLPRRPEPAHLPLPRLRHQRLQHQQALRPLHHRTARRRPPAQPHRRAARRHRVQPAQHDDPRGRRAAGEYLAKYAADRVRTVSAAFLGSTMGCAECHDHKYDPFTLRDFYSLSAFFADVKQWGVTPTMVTPRTPSCADSTTNFPSRPRLVVESPYLRERMADRPRHGRAGPRSRPQPQPRRPCPAGKPRPSAFLQAHPDGWFAPIPGLPNARGGGKTNAVARAEGLAHREGLGQRKDLRVELEPGAGWVAAVRLEVLPHDPDNGGRLVRGKAGVDPPALDAWSGGRMKKEEKVGCLRGLATKDAACTTAERTSWACRAAGGSKKRPPEGARRRCGCSNPAAPRRRRPARAAAAPRSGGCFARLGFPREHRVRAGAARPRRAAGRAGNGPGRPHAGAERACRPRLDLRHRSRETGPPSRPCTTTGSNAGTAAPTRW
jgi:hypothetical protein